MIIIKDSVLPVCAVRYALGRETYIPSMVVTEIMPLVHEMQDSMLTVMAKDLAEYLFNETKDINIAEWRHLYEEILAEQVRRAK